MNEHEIERIAAAMHHMRPDWPVASLRTLISKKLGDRPRRDVAVALAWVACESGTATPARVLETGPWWKAAAVDGAAKSANKVPRDRRCSTCSLDRDQCRRIWATDHEFEPDFRDKRDGDTVRQIAQAVKAEIQPVATETEVLAGDLTDDHIGMVVLGAGSPGWERHLLLRSVERRDGLVYLAFRWNDDPSPQNTRRGQYAIGHYLEPTVPVIVRPSVNPSSPGPTTAGADW